MTDLHLDPRPVPPPKPGLRRRKVGAGRWLWPAAALAAFAALLLVLTLDRGTEPVSSTLGGESVGAMSEAAAAGATPRRDRGPAVRHQLPDGVVLTVPARGAEAALLAFLEDPYRLADQTTWFELDGIVFEAGSARLSPASADQLDALAAILRAWPTVLLKIGGYTDDSGDRGANRRLSQARAEAVREALVAQGVGERRIEAEGYGEQFPVASNDTEEGRHRNRRIDIRVTAK